MKGEFNVKAYDLKPTWKNLLNTLKDDAIDRNNDVFRLVNILNNIEDSCTIALEGNWGSGKTFFVKQVKMVLDAYNEHISVMDNSDKESITKISSDFFAQNGIDLQPQVCVYYDAWENDNDDDPVISLIYEILKSVNIDFSFTDRSFTKIAANILENFTGKNWGRFIDSLKGENPLSDLKRSKRVEEMVQDFLKSLLVEKGNRLIIIIDELDRCKPNYAVRLLERIKHYFSNDNITFVFSVNINELQHTVRKHYGNDFNASRYLDRFFDLRVSLPTPNMGKFYSSLSFTSNTYVFDIVCRAVAEIFHFEMREIAKFLRLVKIAAYEPTHKNHHSGFPDERARFFCLYFIVPIMVGLKLHDVDRYNDFLSGKDSSPLVEVANSLQYLVFADLLSDNETFDENDKEKKIVTIEEKMIVVYDTLFITDYSGNVHYKGIGSLAFDNNAKDMILRTVGLLSMHTNTNID